MEIRRGLPSDYDVMLNHVVQSFRENNPGHFRFEHLFPDVINASPETMGYWRFAFIDGEMAAGIELIPRQMKIGAAEFTSGGIKSVAQLLSPAPDLSLSGRAAALPGYPACYVVDKTSGRTCHKMHWPPLGAPDDPNEKADKYFRSADPNGQKADKIRVRLGRYVLRQGAQTEQAAHDQDQQKN